MKTIEDIKPLASLIEHQQQSRLVAEGYTLEIHRPNYTVKVEMGKKYARVDIGTAGRYMVELETGDIYGVKAYGVIHRGHRYGNLDTINEWDWSDYKAFPIAQTFAPAAIN